MGSLPGRKLAGCFIWNEIAIEPHGPTRMFSPNPAVALDGPDHYLLDNERDNMKTYNIGKGRSLKLRKKNDHTRN